MMSASLVIGRPVALRQTIMVEVAMEEMAVSVVVAVATVAVAALIMDREILVQRTRTRRCVSSMARPTPRARTVD